MTEAESYTSPWVGSDYEGGGFGGLRVLVVGESHYSDEPASETTDITCTVMEDYLSDLRRYPFFNTIARILMDNRLDDRNNFWQKVSFINFVQRVVEQGSRPTPDDYRESLPRFRRIISELRPDLVCFFSAAAWEWRPWGSEPWAEAFGAKPVHLEGSYELTRYDTSWDQPVLMARFNHPRGLGAPIDVWRAWFGRIRHLAASSGWQG